MSTDAILVLIGIFTFVFSVGTSVFVSGITVGRFSGNVKSIESRLSRIEGMFTLVLKSDLTITHTDKQQ